MRYFVNEHTRMVRTTDDVASVPPQPWKEVDSAGYDQFRKETKTFKPKVLKEMRGLK